ncbi:phosphoribosylamine--glycine ligase, partial [Candidatus Woesearchaeota archaeon]|nr:phosphoribosylamine--glycine ligase [Candidatus Woesearchaeota archaeon]
FILTKKGVKLVEYNARFGDPEAMNVLPLLKTDLAGICHAIITQELSRVKVEFEKKATVCKYVVPNGYPDAPLKNEKIEILKNYGRGNDGKGNNNSNGSAKMYYASVEQRSDGLYMLGSRAIAFLGIGDNLDEAEKIAEEGASSVKGKVFHRKDIGTKELIQKRVEHIKNILG